jgi:hypothetical protein
LIFGLEVPLSFLFSIKPVMESSQRMSEREIQNEKDAKHPLTQVLMSPENKKPITGGRGSTQFTTTQP